MMKTCKCRVPDDNVELSVSTDRSDTEFSEIKEFVDSVSKKFGTSEIDMVRCFDHSDHEVVVFHAFPKRDTICD